MKFRSPFSKFWKPKSDNPQGYRRIYEGDVPVLNDAGGPPKAVLSEEIWMAGTFSETLTTKESRTLIDSTTGLPRPVNVRRASIISPEGSKTRLRNDEMLPQKFPNNEMITSRYTVFTFIPKNLFEQFRRIVNFYFLCIAIIQSTIDSPINPATAVSPLAFVIMVTAIKQGYEDWLRHKNDEQVNSRLITIIKDGNARKIKAKDIQVGDVIQLEADEQVPTDLLLLGSSDEFLRCQINTANLDGETSLKLKYCPSGLPHFKRPEHFQHLHIIVECEQPCPDLYEFNGSLLIPTNKLHEMNSLSTEHAFTTESASSTASDGRKAKGNKDLPIELKSGLVRQGLTDFLSIPLSMDNMVLRGTRLKNTDFIFGYVIYTGRDTRLARNSEKSEAKFSTVEKAVNYYLIFFIAVLIILVMFSSMMHFFVDWGQSEEEKKKSENAAFYIVTSFLILYNYIIPISLYVTIEIQKFLGSKFFVWDEDMIDEEGKEPLCNTSDLNEELGQIEYVFSDKTGTLTQNIMKFRHCSVGGVRYEYKDDHNLYRVHSHSHHDDDHHTHQHHHHHHPPPKPVDVVEDKMIFQFFLTLALCHSVQVVPRRRPSFDTREEKGNGLFSLNILRKRKTIQRRQTNSTLEPSTNTEETAPLSLFPTEYQASSPDEKALLEACQTLGLHYRGEKEDVMTLEVNGRPESYKRLMHLEFDADRKCMSVIVKNSADEIWLLTKGAESSIIPKCDQGPTQESLQHVLDYALMGLRTLAVSVRKLTARQYEEFDIELRAARRLLKNRQQKVREVFRKMESHMTLIGATGVEDQLQDFVPETLQSFAAAGIRVWMLTGDKLETGVNVAVSCGLITASTKQYIVSRSTNAVEIENRLRALKGELNDDDDNTCFVIDGDSLAIAFRECPELLRDVSMAAFRVVCCRMAPLQKAQVVQMVKNSPGKPITCAVGDGANDCAMILAAHIGIGILGKEGRQAARCADFALAKFGYLRKAILVHGHWYYVRLANLANYFFYKNLVFVLPQFYFGFHSMFSAQALFNSIYLMLYNILFSACPVFFYGLTEQPYSKETLLRDPGLYRENNRNHLMSNSMFLPWLISAVWHSMASYFLPYFAWDNADIMTDVTCFGTVVFCGVLLASNIKMAIETKFINWWTVGAHLYSYASFLLCCGLYSEVDLRPIGIPLPGDFRYVLFYVFSSIYFWLLMLLVGIITVVPDLLLSAIRHAWENIAIHLREFEQDTDICLIEGKEKSTRSTLLFNDRSGSLAVSSSTIVSSRI